MQKSDIQNTKNRLKIYRQYKKSPLKQFSMGKNYTIDRISEILQPRAMQISSRSFNFTFSALLLHRSQMVEGRAFINTQSSFCFKLHSFKMVFKLHLIIKTSVYKFYKQNNVYRYFVSKKNTSIILYDKLFVIAFTKIILTCNSCYDEIFIQFTDVFVIVVR